ncbi:acyl carrier protein [Actinokineospora sp. NBRC 105648]|uniref:acyl carrier protein n=1 Tax=Actinokineospora sp. NBRC 105648 TaxID=3032206 RepID=UPI0024A07C9E|nr:acyl carrier protein [Actinokineospora sp. NBRC 105648]GLZ39688.1 hypothetical protein Acsp05_33120 [Actinokineospora sp. NBRC 105648]
MDDRFTELLAANLPLLGDGQLTEDTRLRDIGLDSMGALDLLFGIEDTFAVSLSDEDLNDTTFGTAGSLWQAITAAMAAQAPATP